MRSLAPKHIHPPNQKNPNAETFANLRHIQTNARQIQNMAQTFQQVDISTWHYSDPHRNANGGMNLWINESATSKTAPVFQLEPVVAKFGTRAPMENSTSTRRNMEVAVQSKELLEFIQNVDKQNIREVAKNSQTYFKKELSEDILAQTLYRWSAATHEKYDPLLRIKIATEGRDPTKVYRVVKEEGNNLETEQGTWEDIQPYCKVLPMVACGGLWFVSKQFGMSWIAKAVLVWPSEKKAQNNFVGYNINTRPTLTVNNASNDDVEMDNGGDDIM